MDWLFSKLTMHHGMRKPQEQANAHSGGRAAPGKIVQVVLFWISMKNELLCSQINNI